MMKLEGMTNDSDENHREIASSSFELQAWFIIRDWNLSFLARLRNCFPDPGCGTKPTTEVCLVYCAALNAAQR